jgi:hypothetical protein
MGRPLKGTLAFAATALFIALAATAAVADPRAEARGGNIYAGEGALKQLTTTGRDVEPILTPDKKSVIFTRQGKGPTADFDDCTFEGVPDELRLVWLDGSGEELLARGHEGKKPEEQLCGFRRKQFSSDGQLVYFLSPAWTTSSALHVYDRKAKKVTFVMPANDVIVLNDCAKAEYRDNLVVQQHRYFVVAGSYDWYWLYDRAGKKEKGPLGEQDGEEGVRDAIAGVSLCNK